MGLFKSSSIVACIVILSVVVLAQGVEQDRVAFKPKKNIFNEGDLLQVRVSFRDEPNKAIFELKDVPYTYSRGAIISKELNFTKGELLKHKHYLVIIFTEAYKSFQQMDKKHQGPVQAPRQVTNSTFPIFKQDDKKRKYLENEVQIHLLHSENITSPNHKLAGMYPNMYDDYFMPQLDTSQFWVLKQNHVYLKEEPDTPEDLEKQIKVKFEFQIVSDMGLIMTHSMKQAFNENPMFETMGEQMKELLGKNSIEYLAFMVFANGLHGIFHTLSIKNDLQYWGSIKKFEGVSLGVIWWDLFLNIIQILYMWDQQFNGAPIYFLYLSFASCVYRIIKVYCNKTESFPYFSFSVPKSYRSSTQSVEKNFIRWQLRIIVVLLGCYIGYRYYTEPPKEGVYSFLLKCVMYFTVGFSFVQMTPQLYINYINKSVPPMPWRTLVYKFLDATVDDLITLALSLPFLSLIMHFVDDAVFFLLMIQRCYYGEKKQPAMPLEDQNSQSVSGEPDKTHPQEASSEEETRNRGKSQQIDPPIHPTKAVSSKNSKEKDE